MKQTPFDLFGRVAPIPAGNKGPRAAVAPGPAAWGVGVALVSQRRLGQGLP